MELERIRKPSTAADEADPQRPFLAARPSLPGRLIVQPLQRNPVGAERKTIGVKTELLKRAPHQAGRHQHGRATVHRPGHGPLPALQSSDRSSRQPAEHSNEQPPHRQGQPRQWRRQTTSQMLHTIGPISAGALAGPLLRKLKLPRGAGEPVIREAQQCRNAAALCRPEQAEGVAPQVKHMQGIRLELLKLLPETGL